MPPNSALTPSSSASIDVDIFERASNSAFDRQTVDHDATAVTVFKHIQQQQLIGEHNEGGGINNNCTQHKNFHERWSTVSPLPTTKLEHEPWHALFHFPSACFVTTTSACFVTTSTTLQFTAMANNYVEGPLKRKLSVPSTQRQLRSMVVAQSPRSPPQVRLGLG